MCSGSFIKYYLSALDYIQDPISAILESLGPKHEYAWKLSKQFYYSTRSGENYIN